MEFPTEIIGIDPGLYYPAFAAVDPKSGDLLRVCSFNGKQKKLMAAPNQSVRCHKLVADMMKQIVLVPGTKVVGIEGAVRMRGWQTIERFGRYRQAVFEACKNHLPDFEHMEFYPTDIKRAFTGNGRADKKEMIAVVRSRFKVTLSLKQEFMEAEADAIAIACLTWQRWRRS